MPDFEHYALGGTGGFGTASGNHAADSASAATQAARFLLPAVAADVGRIVKQTSDKTYWMLTDHTLVAGASGWTQVGVRETSGPTSLAWGSVPDNSVVVRVGAALVAAVISAPLSLTAGTLAVAAVGNASAGVAPIHAGGADVGKALIATATAAAWGTDFGTRTLTTTGEVAIGTNPASAGPVRLANAAAIRGRNAANSADVDLLTVTSAVFTNQVTLGSTSFNSSVEGSTLTYHRILGDHRLIFTSTGGIRLGFDAGLVLAGASATFNITTTTSATVSQLNISGQTTSAVGGTGGALLVTAGSATGASGTRTGGAAGFQPGSGASAGGELYLATGAGTKRFRLNDTGLAFFNVAPAAQPADMVALTSFGVSADRVLADVGIAFSQAIINANFDDCAAAINALRTQQRTLGLMA